MERQQSTFIFHPGAILTNLKLLYKLRIVHYDCFHDRLIIVDCVIIHRLLVLEDFLIKRRLYPRTLRALDA